MHKPQPAASAAPKAAPKPFDMVASMESISAAIERASDAYANMVAAEGRVIEIEQVLSDLADAKQSIEKYGVAVENMSLINRDQNFTSSVGLEALSLESIQTLSADTKKMLQSQYVTAIEGQVVDMIKTAIARIKDFFAKMVKYLADAFTANAKLVDVVKNLKFDGDLDEEASVSAISAEDAETAVAGLKTMAGDMDKLRKGEEGSTVTVPEAKSETLKALGWTKEKATALKDKFVSEVSTVKAFSDAWKEFQGEAKKAEAEGNSDDKSVLDKLSAYMKKWVAARKVTGAYVATWRRVAFALIAVDRKCKKAAAPAA